MRQTGNFEGFVVKRIFIQTATESDWQKLLAKPVTHCKQGASVMKAVAAWESAGAITNV